MFTKHNKNYPPNSKGFTLIEILVTLAIFLILSFVLVINLRFKVSKDALNQGIEKLITSFRQAQTLTLTGIKIGSVSPDYGLYLNTTSPTNFKIFADLDRGKDYDAGEENNANCGIFDLPTGVEIFGLAPVTGTSLTVVFSATNTEDIYFNSTLAAQDAVITLKNTKTSETNLVTIYQTSGQISR